MVDQGRGARHLKLAPRPIGQHLEGLHRIWMASVTDRQPGAAVPPSPPAAHWAVYSLAAAFFVHITPLRKVTSRRLKNDGAGAVVSSVVLLRWHHRRPYLRRHAAFDDSRHLLQITLHPAQIGEALEVEVVLIYAQRHGCVLAILPSIVGCQRGC
jgi:hypothetical protein